MDVNETIKMQYLCMAIKQGWETDVKRYIKLNPSIADKVYHNTTPTLVAIMTNQPQMVQLLLDANIDVNNCGAATTPLVAAVLNNNYDIAQLLIDNGADIDFVTNVNTVINPYTPLHAAIELDNESMVTWLLTQLKASSSSSSLSTLSSISSSTSLSSSLSTSIMICAIKTSPSMVLLLYDALLSANDINGAMMTTTIDVLEILLCGIRENCVKTVEIFIQSPFVTKQVLDDSTLMNSAINFGNKSIMAVLGDSGVVFDI